jgi:hypothetical protein
VVARRGAAREVLRMLRLVSAGLGSAGSPDEPQPRRSRRRILRFESFWQVWLTMVSHPALPHKAGRSWRAVVWCQDTAASPASPAAVESLKMQLSGCGQLITAPTRRLIELRIIPHTSRVGIVRN